MIYNLSINHFMFIFFKLLSDSSISLGILGAGLKLGEATAPLPWPPSQVPLMIYQGSYRTYYSI